MADELRIASHLTGVVEFSTTVEDDGTAYTSKVQDTIIGAQGGSYKPTYDPTKAIKYAGGQATTNVVEGAVTPQQVSSAITGATISGTEPSSVSIYYVRVESHTGSPGDVIVKVGDTEHAKLGLNEAVAIPLVSGSPSNCKLDGTDYNDTLGDRATVTVILA